VRLAEGRLPRPDDASPKLLKQLLEQNPHLGLDNQGKVHLLLTVAPAPRLDRLYRVVFEGILNEKISTNPVDVAGL
jgi:preprotein translocase subunit SecD